jgi:hypothetical protein
MWALSNRVGGERVLPDLSQNRAYGSVHGSSYELDPDGEGFPVREVLCRAEKHPTVGEPVV